MLILYLSVLQVYVRNLPFAATEQDIDHFFSQAGRVEDVRRGAGPDGAHVPRAVIPVPQSWLPLPCWLLMHLQSVPTCCRQSAGACAEGEWNLSCLQCARMNCYLYSGKLREAVLRREAARLWLCAV